MGVTPTTQTFRKDVARVEGYALGPWKECIKTFVLINSYLL